MAAGGGIAGRYLKMAVIRSFIFMLVFYTGSLFHVITAFVAQWFSIPLMQWAVRAWSKWQYWCYRWILGINIRVEGQLSDRPVLYAIKHESMFETIDMPRMFGKPAVITKKELFDIPMWGSAARAYGMIPVDREGGAAALRAMLALAKKMIAQDRPIIIFPEGTRGHADEPQPFKSGLYTLATRFPDVVLVPAWINNVQRVMPKGEVVPVPILCSVTFGAPVKVESGEERRPFLDRARQAVIALRDV